MRGKAAKLEKSGICKGKNGGMGNWGTFIREDGETCTRVTNKSAHGEILVTGACNHRSTDVVDM